MTGDRHVAIVYFHGMGSQRHYEELCSLVDRLDHAAWALGRTPGSRFDGIRLRERSARVELPRDGEAAGPGHDVVYFLARAVDSHQRHPTRTLRFYEAYWAPDVVDGTTASSVAMWLVRQVRKPLQLRFGPWREYRRLRRGSLVALYRRRRDRGAEDPGALHARTAKLVGYYELFQTPASRGRYPRGSFLDFLKLVEYELGESGASAEERAATLRLAGDWHFDHLAREVLHFLGIVTVLAGALGLLGLIGIFVIKLLASARLWLPMLLPQMPLGPLQLTPSLFLTGLSAVLSGLGIRSFLADYVGDVQQYVSYEETDRLYARRKAVLESATSQLRHVLENESCERVVVVAHSLGAAIAVDTLLELARYNRAAGSADPLAGPIPLRKIEHLITYGSPVDKVNYFFAVVHSESGAYDQLAEDLRGDIGTPPFSRTDREPHIHWINFWDKGDIISGPTETVASSHLREEEVDNVRLADYALPDLLNSHGAYADQPGVLEALLQVILFRSYNYVDPPRDAAGRPDWAALRLGPGKGSAAQSVAFAFTLLLPWLLLGASLEIAFLRHSFVMRWSLAAVVAVHAIGYAAHRWGSRHHRNAVKRVAESAG